MRKLVYSFVLEPHWLLHATISHEHPLNREHIIELKCLIPRLDISESDVGVIDVWLLPLELLLVVLVLQLGHLGVDAPHLLFVDGRVDFVVFHLFLQH